MAKKLDPMAFGTKTMSQPDVMKNAMNKAYQSTYGKVPKPSPAKKLLAKKLTKQGGIGKNFR